MRDDFEEDPEVIADLKLRAATMRDPKRSREAPTFSPAKIIAHVPCRARCGSLVDWTEEAEDAFAIWNGILERRGEASLDKTRIVFCISCRDDGRAAAAIDKRKATDQLAHTIRELKNSPNPESEHAKIQRATSLGHPDVPGLLQAIRLRLDGGKAKRQGTL